MGRHLTTLCFFTRHYSLKDVSTRLLVSKKFNTHYLFFCFSAIFQQFKIEYWHLDPCSQINEATSVDLGFFTRNYSLNEVSTMNTLVE